MSVLLILATGAEEMETVIPADVMRRAEVCLYRIASVLYVTSHNKRYLMSFFE